MPPQFVSWQEEPASLAGAAVQVAVPDPPQSVAPIDVRLNVKVPEADEVELNKPEIEYVPRGPVPVSVVLSVNPLFTNDATGAELTENSPSPALHP